MENRDLHEELENFEMVRYRMKAEGFHYCFKNYSSFDEIKDPEFHKLRKYYLQHAELLKNYVNNTIESLENKIDEEFD